MLKKLFKFNKILFVAPLMTLMFCFNAPKNDDEKMHIIMINVKNALTHVHYQPKPINDAFSREVYKSYFETIDPAKRYFLQSDMEEFEKHRNQLDDYLNNGNLVFYKQTIDRLYQRVSEIDKMTQDILSKPIDLNENDELILEPKLKKAPADKQELYNEWKSPKYIPIPETGPPARAEPPCARTLYAGRPAAGTERPPPSHGRGSGRNWRDCRTRRHPPRPSPCSRSGPKGVLRSRRPGS